MRSNFIRDFDLKNWQCVEQNSLKRGMPYDESSNSRQPISIPDIKKVQSLCKDIDEKMRWLIALISDTGLRLGEAAGLLKEDFKLDEPIPVTDFKPHSCRSLKTKSSHRLIPLTIEALGGL